MHNEHLPTLTFYIILHQVNSFYIYPPGMPKDFTPANGLRHLLLEALAAGAGDHAIRSKVQWQWQGKWN
jgi:hypothetical protein